MFLIIFIVYTYTLLLENALKNNISKEKEKIFDTFIRYLVTKDVYLVTRWCLHQIVNFRLQCLQKFPSWGRGTFWPQNV